MDKYQALWNYVKNQSDFPIKMTFEQIEKILSFPIDHSFLKYKKQLNEYGYNVKKISLKDKFVNLKKFYRTLSNNKLTA